MFTKGRGEQRCHREDGATQALINHSRKPPALAHGHQGKPGPRAAGAAQRGAAETRPGKPPEARERGWARGLTAFPSISYQSPRGQGPGKPASSRQPCDAEPSGGGVRLRAKARDLDRTGVLGNGSLLRPVLGSPAPKTLTGSCVTSSFTHGGGRRYLNTETAKRVQPLLGETPVTPTLSARRRGWSRPLPINGGFERP